MEDNNNPAWNEFLNIIPEDLHSQITPILSQWDKNIQAKFDTVASEWEPYKNFKDNKIDPQNLEFGINLVNQLSNDPKSVYDALKEHYKFDIDKITDTAKPSKEDTEDTVDPYETRFREYDDRINLLSRALIAKHQKEAEELEDRKLNNELDSLRKTHGDFDEQWVLSRMYNGVKAEDAVKNYLEWETGIRNRYSPKPLIMGTGGGIPIQSIDPVKLNDRQVRDLIVEQLKAASLENKR